MTTAKKYCPVCRKETEYLVGVDAQGYTFTCRECRLTDNLEAPKSNKFHAVRTWSELCQRFFDSKAEARRGEELALLEKAEEIWNLTYQVKFCLTSPGVKPKVTISIDFRYWDTGGVIVHEDVKGVLTRDFRTKLAWLQQSQGIDVLLVRG